MDFGNWSFSESQTIFSCFSMFLDVLSKTDLMETGKIQWVLKK